MTTELWFTIDKAGFNHISLYDLMISAECNSEYYCGANSPIYEYHVTFEIVETPFTFNQNVEQTPAYSFGPAAEAPDALC